MLILKTDLAYHSSFRELVDIWEAEGFVQVQQSPDEFCWALGHGQVLLFDYDRIDDRRIPPFGYGLFGNTVPDHPRTSPWILWGRHPILLEEVRAQGIPTLQERAVESVFLGKIENEVQRRNRVQLDWSTAGIEIYHCEIAAPGPGVGYPYTPRGYLEVLGRSRYGLGLAGYGPKCNREIELLGMGVVPLLAPEVDVTYAHPLVEDVHFLRVDGPQDVARVIASTSDARWQELHEAGQEWYRLAASPKGSFNVTVSLIERAIATAH